MAGVYTLNLQQGASDALREEVLAVVDHPALVVWEGPDEVVWNFTAYSGLHRTMGVHKTPGEWWRQTPEAVAYAEKQAAVIIPNMRDAVALVRELDTRDRPVWINEARDSDTEYVRQCLEFLDITGCDYYPVKAGRRPIANMGAVTDRWTRMSQEKPVWMVLQAFSWDELGDYYKAKETAYPTFAESRFMAYDVIVHGARGILYWGSHYLKSDAFRQSVYALTSELAALQPFLAAEDTPDVGVYFVEAPDEPGGMNVHAVARQAGDDWLVLVVNEDDAWHMGVVVEGLDALTGRDLHLLYGEETRAVRRGELVVRMPPLDVKVYATSRAYEAAQSTGRDFVR